MNPAIAATGVGTDGLAENIVRFCRTLRLSGLKLGPGATVDALAAVESAGIGTRADFYWTLHAVLVKRHEDDPVFNTAFRLFWRRRDQNEAIIAGMLPLAPQTAIDQPGKRRVELALSENNLAHLPKPRTESRQEADMRGTASEMEVLRQKDFAQMTAEEIAEARRHISRLPFAWQEVSSRRLIADPRGRRLDLRRTLRASLRASGEMIELRRRAPVRRRPPIVALLDISGSMSDYSRVALHFLHTLAEARGRVSTFVFGTRLTNVTRALKARDPDEALAVCGMAARDWAGGTRIASSLRAFNKEWSRRELAHSTIVLLITDGLERDAGENLGREMDRLRRSCRRLIWLNPLLRYAGFEPKASGIRAMMPHVGETRSVHNLASLETLCTALAADRWR